MTDGHAARGIAPAQASVHDPGHDSEIRAALDRVYDPCSLAVNNPLSLVDMGLVRDWHLDPGGALRVRLCVTSPNCMMAPKFLEAARMELGKIDGLAAVEVQVDPTVFWTPELMSERGRRRSRLRHARSLRRAPVRPQQWRGQGIPEIAGAEPAVRTAKPSSDINGGKSERRAISDAVPPA